MDASRASIWLKRQQLSWLMKTDGHALKICMRHAPGGTLQQLNDMAHTDTTDSIKK